MLKSPRSIPKSAERNISKMASIPIHSPCIRAIDIRPRRTDEDVIGLLTHQGRTKTSMLSELFCDVFIENITRFRADDNRTTILYNLIVARCTEANQLITNGNTPSQLIYILIY